MRDLRLAAALLIPILAIGAWITRLNEVVQNGKLIHVAIRGYDPRDLLAGHYMQYQLDLGEIQPCTEARDELACVCFTESRDSTQLSTPLWGGKCSHLPADCPVSLSGHCQGFGRFVSGIERFYVPESLAPDVQILPTGASVMARIDRNQRVVVDLLIDGMPLDIYVEASRKAQASK